ncbi:hypothetical protein GCM10010524_56940 [Streptomyces mexicanus]
MDDGRVDVVDAVAQPREFVQDGGVDVTGTGAAGGHGDQPYGVGEGLITGAWRIARAHAGPRDGTARAARYEDDRARPEDCPGCGRGTAGTVRG